MAAEGLVLDNQIRSGATPGFSASHAGYSQNAFPPPSLNSAQKAPAPKFE